MQPYWMTHFLLPDQEHAHAQAVGEALEQARESVAGLVGCESFEIVFTSGGTEANNLAILGLLTSPAHRNESPGHVLVSQLEHDSVTAAARSLEAAGIEVEMIPCEPEGVIDPDRVKSMLRDDTRLVCLQLANPVLGTIQPVREVADLCHNQGVRLHCDATQVFGKLSVDTTRLRADTIAISGHKFYGPKGIGAIYVRRGLHLSPIAYGEPREMGLRPGAENVPACIGMGAAANLASRCAGEVSDNFSELSARLLKGLQSSLSNEPILLAEDAPRIPNTLAIEMPREVSRIRRAARQLVFATAQSTEPPDEITRALKAIGRTDAQIGRTLRISLGWTTSRDQVDRAVGMLAEACG
ncbi:Cysteine desulfurase [Novipirellula artificiosorum]|uniref:Cysteine desulfurase n=2 Tax=Novipirellula artificiosorum TaxID=2528016 RepID=A0A5C6DGG0_9BACT|nr:Cysteine desulfurase [Novipirellula artificiosorum]